MGELKKMGEKYYLSKSGYQLYKRCPKQYYFRYIKKLPGTSSIAMSAGTEFHDAAEAFMKDLIKTKAVPNFEFMPEFKFERNVDPWLHFMANEKWRWENVKDTFYPVMLEDFITNDELLIRGIVDRVDIMPNGEIIVIDYKTGNSKAKSTEYYFYKLLLDKSGKFDKPVRYGALFYVTQNKIDQKKLSDKRAENLLVKINEVRAKIDAGEFPEKKSEFTCKWCSYAKECMEAGE